MSQGSKPSRGAGRRGPLPPLSDEQCAVLPRAAAHLDAHQGWPQIPRRSHKPRLRHFQTLQNDNGGPLALLRVSLPELDQYPLRSADLAAEVKSVLYTRLSGLLLLDSPLTVDVQRGRARPWKSGGTHAHACTRLACLAPDARAQVDAARHGPGGGTLLLGGLAHGVVVRDTPTDLERTARYVVLPPVSELNQYGTWAFLEALESELERKERKEKRVRLAWTVGL